MADPAAANDDFFADADDVNDALEDANDDNYEDAYDDLEDSDQSSGEGVFADKTGVFDSRVRNGGERADHTNLQTTRDQEINNERLTPKKSTDMRSRQLIAVFDGQGKPKVAVAVNGNRVEAFRDPTKAEHDALRERGRLVKQGTTTPQTAIGDAAPVATGTSPWLIGAGVLAAAGAAYFVYTKYASEEDDLEEDADEV